MWQRIQTVFLVIVVISLLIGIFFPIWASSDGTVKRELYALHFSTTTQDGTKTSNYYPYCITAVLLIASMTIALIEITKFKDRLLQIKLGTLNSILLAGSVMSSVYFATDLVKTHDGGQYGIAMFLPFIAVICNWIAMRFIRRDEKLVRDSNRLR